MTSGEAANSRKTWLGVAALVLTAALWSLNGPLIKLLNAQGGGVSGVSIAFYRSFAGGILFLPFAVRHWKTRLNAPIRWRIGSIFSFTLMTVTFVVATTQTAAANAIVLQYSAPIWIVALSPVMLKERVQQREAAVLGVAMIGVAVIYFANPTTDRLGLTLALASGFGYAAVLIALRGLRNVHPIVVVCSNCVGSALLLAPLVALNGSFALTLPQMGLLAAMGIAQFAIPYALYSWAAQSVEAHRASLIVLIETILNPLWTYLVVGETVPTPTLMGGPIILTSVAAWIGMTWHQQRSSVRRVPVVEREKRAD